MFAVVGILVMMAATGPVLFYRGPSLQDWQQRYIWALRRQVRWHRAVDKAHWAIYVAWALIAVDLWGSWFFLLVVFGGAFNAVFQRRDRHSGRMWEAKARAEEDLVVSETPMPQNPSGLF